MDYRGRIAPSPTGRLHLGHARTFWMAQKRAVSQGGCMVFRMEDLDLPRCSPEHVQGCLEDLKWLGLAWQEGPDKGGPYAPYLQSHRTALYKTALTRLAEEGHVYRCYCSRKDIERAVRAPHASDDDPIYPGTCRNLPTQSGTCPQYCWRFKVPAGETVRFEDERLGSCQYEAGRDFGDFVVWRADGIPSYQLAVTVDDHLMRITEVVRGEDLLVSTARQLLLYHALNWMPPSYYHCPLVTDDTGQRLAKRHRSLSLQAMRIAGATPKAIREKWQQAFSSD
jgi:glutamyl-queuosine tRNA(Asp) synthetase